MDLGDHSGQTGLQLIQIGHRAAELLRDPVSDVTGGGTSNHHGSAGQLLIVTGLRVERSTIVTDVAAVRGSDPQSEDGLLAVLAALQGQLIGAVLLDQSDVLQLQGRLDNNSVAGDHDFCHTKFSFFTNMYLVSSSSRTPHPHHEEVRPFVGIKIPSQKAGYSLARRVGFEPTGGLPPPVFKTGAINQALPSPQIFTFSLCYTETRSSSVLHYRLRKS